MVTQGLPDGRDRECACGAYPGAYPDCPRVSGPGFLNVSGSVKLAVEEKCRAESHEHCSENEHDRGDVGGKEYERQRSEQD